MRFAHYLGALGSGRLVIARREHATDSKRFKSYRWLFFNSAEGKKEELSTLWLRNDGHVVTMSVTIIGEAKDFTPQA